jgi:cell division protein FtsL
MNLSNEILKKISNLFFIENKKVFVYMLLIGIILISIGIIFKIFNIGFKINSFIEKIKREKFEEDTKKTDGKIKKILKR